jgi:acetyl esterase/lipase
MRYIPQVEVLSERILATMTPATPPYSQFVVQYGNLVPSEQNLTVIWDPNNAANQAGTSKIMVFVHGGGWYPGSNSTMIHQFADWAAAHGYTGVFPNYRLVTSSGKNPYPAAVDDVAASIAWVEEHAGQFGADPNTVIVYGGSAGGQIGSLLYVDPTQDWFTDETVPRAPLNIKGFVGDSGVYDWSITPLLPYEQRYLGPYYGPGHWNSTEAITYANNRALPPALLIDGTSDGLTNYHNSVEFADALDKAGVHATLKLYQGYTHVEFNIHFARSAAEQTYLADWLVSEGLGN